MKLIYIFFVLAVPVFGVLNADYTRGYTKKNGTYVQPYHKSHPDAYRYNNYSSKGNVNPYTGKQGTQLHEFSNPPKYNKGSGNHYRYNSYTKDSAKYKSGIPRY